MFVLTQGMLSPLDATQGYGGEGTNFIMLPDSGSFLVTGFGATFNGNIALAAGAGQFRIRGGQTTFLPALDKGTSWIRSMAQGWRKNRRHYGRRTR